PIATGLDNGQLDPKVRPVILYLFLHPPSLRQSECAAAAADSNRTHRATRSLNRLTNSCSSSRGTKPPLCSPRQREKCKRGSLVRMFRSLFLQVKEFLQCRDVKRFVVVFTFAVVL